MQINIELQNLFSYSLTPIILISIIIIILLILCIKKKKEIPPPTMIIPKDIDINIIKTKYLNSINKLMDNVNNNSITTRKAYQKLSLLTRNFVYETTNIKVQNYTLKEINDLHMPILYELVNDYYVPEFEKISNGNIELSIKKTIEVIKKWN